MNRYRFFKPICCCLMLGCSVMLLSSCEDTKEFNADELFSLEDMARDQDYADALINMMNRWRVGINRAILNLGANPQAIPFNETIPEGWSRFSTMITLRDSISAISDTGHVVDPDTLIIAGIEGILTQRFYNLMNFYPSSTVIDSIPLDSTLNVFPREITQDTLYVRHYVKRYEIWYEQYYQRTNQDAMWELLRFDYGLPPAQDVYPRKVEYIKEQLNTVLSPDVPQFTTGDSLVLYYADNYRNTSVLSGEGMYGDVQIVYFSTSTTGFSRGAGMLNIWRANISRLSPYPGNPMGDFDIDGITQINDLENQVELSVRADVSLRANATGEGSIQVNGVERARVTFEGYDTEFHGYFKLLRTNFQQKVNF